MKIMWKKPEPGVNNGEIHITGISNDEFFSISEEIKMLLELLERFDDVKSTKGLFKDVVSSWNG